MSNQARVTNNTQHAPLGTVEGCDNVPARQPGQSLEILSKAASSSVTHIDQTFSERVLCFTVKSYNIGEVNEGGTTMGWTRQQ